jgi:hypothetical protein
MTTTTTLSPPDAVTTGDGRATRRLDERRLAGIGAIGFASIVIATNIAQGSLPAMDADSTEIVEYLTAHRTVSLLATAGFAVGALFLLTFASAFYGRLKSAGRRDDMVWARIGMFGAVLILPTFAAVVVQRIVLLVGIDEIIGSPELITFMRAGLLPAWFARWSPVAAAVAVLTAALAVAGLEGSPVGFGGLVPFATWMLLLLIAGVRQLRRAA